MTVKRRSFLKYFLLLTAACRSVWHWRHAQKIRVITTIPDLADITKQIGKELVDVESLTRGVEFMHAVPVKPSFVPKLNRADILVAMGLDLEVVVAAGASGSRQATLKSCRGSVAHIDCSNGDRCAGRAAEQSTALRETFTPRAIRTTISTR